MVFINRKKVKVNIIKKFTVKLAKKKNDVFFFSGKRYLYGLSIYISKILKQVFGISLKRHIKYFASMIKVGLNVSIVFIKNIEFQRLQLYFQKLMLNYELEKRISANIKVKRQLNTYQGARGLMSLPIRGQRTKTNAQTIKKIRQKSLKKDTKRVRKRGKNKIK